MSKLWVQTETVTGGTLYGFFHYAGLPIIGFCLGTLAVYVGYSDDPYVRREVIVPRRRP